MKQDSEMSELKEKMAEFEALNSKWASAESRAKRLTEELKLADRRAFSSFSPSSIYFPYRSSDLSIILLSNGLL